MLYDVEDVVYRTKDYNVVELKRRDENYCSRHTAMILDGIKL